MTKQKVQFFPEIGERAFIAGQSGSGKTAFSVWLLERLQTSPIVIYDTKEEQKFPKLPGSTIVTTREELREATENEEIDYIIVRPPVEELGDAEKLDDWLWYHYQNLRHTVAYIDELAEFHRNGKAFRGLLALLQRGRSRGITTIGATQRPRFLSLSLLSESNKFYIFTLRLKDDRKRMADIVPDFDELPPPPKHGFYFYVNGDEHAKLFAPIKLDDKYDTGYVDKVSDEETEETPLSRHIWV